MRCQREYNGYEIFNRLDVGKTSISIGMKDVYGEASFIVIENYGEDYQLEITYDSYMEAMTDYCSSILEALDELQAGYEILEIPKTPLNADDCKEPDSDYTGKLCILEADALAPDKRTADYQLFYIEGKLSLDRDGETAYLGRCLFDAQRSMLKERQILGEADSDSLPLWAVREFMGFSLQEKKFDPATDVVLQDAKFNNRAIHIVMGTENDFWEEKYNEA